MSFSLGIKLTKMVSAVGEPNTPGRREKKVIKEQKTKSNGSMNIVQENYRLGQTLVINRRWKLYRRLSVTRRRTYIYVMDSRRQIRNHDGTLFVKYKVAYMF